MGCLGKKPPRIRIPKPLPSAAGPALFGIATALALSQVTADAALASTIARPVSVAHQRVASRARPLTAPRLRVAGKPTVRYTVRPGDSLSSIAEKIYRNSGAWTVLYWANRRQIRWADIINAGQVLDVPAKPVTTRAALSEIGPAPALVSTGAAVSAADRAQSSSQSAASAQTATTYSGSRSLRRCVIARESGGNSQVMNSAGYYGLYQFSASTWAAYGGHPADFGRASVTEQNRVFDNAIAAGGASNWTAYDGC